MEGRPQRYRCVLHRARARARRGNEAKVAVRVAALAGGPKTPAVTVTVNGSYTFSGRVGRMGGENLVGFNKAVRTAAGVEAGDTIDAVLSVDAAPRDTAVPDDLAAALGQHPVGGRRATPPRG